MPIYREVLSSRVSMLVVCERWCILLCFSAGMRCTPLIVEVHARKAIEADVDDNGFQPRIIRIDEGNSVHWQWSDCAIPHQVNDHCYWGRSAKGDDQPQNAHQQKGWPLSFVCCVWCVDFDTTSANNARTRTIERKILWFQVHQMSESLHLKVKMPQLKN